MSNKTKEPLAGSIEAMKEVLEPFPEEAVRSRGGRTEGIIAFSPYECPSRMTEEERKELLKLWNDTSSFFCVPFKSNPPVFFGTGGEVVKTASFDWDKRMEG